MESSGIVVRAITRCGGIADAGTVIRLTSRQAVPEAVERRVIVRDALVSAHDSFRGHGRRHVLRVIEAADARAANPFESVLRAIALDVPGLQRLPQVEIRTPGRRLVRPDLVDARLKIAVEADSFEHHGSRKALVLDCVRYDNLVADGWTVLRFAWEHVMHRPAWVRSTLVAVTDQLIAAAA